MSRSLAAKGEALDPALPLVTPPAAPRRLSRETTTTLAVVTVLFAFAFVALPSLISLYYVDALTQAAIYAVVAAGLGVLVGRVGLYSLGQAAVLAIGAWSAARLLYGTGLPYPVVLLAAALVTMVIGTILGLPALRVRGLYLALITLMLAGAISIVLATTNFPNGAGGFLGYNGSAVHPPPIRQPAIGTGDTAYYRYTLVVAALMFILVLVHVRSRPGRAWAAIRQSESAALAAGINVTFYKLWAWALASFVTGMAGGLLAGSAPYLYSIDFPVQNSITLLAVVLMGGAYSLWGAVIAGLLIQLLPALFQSWSLSNDWITILFGVGVLQVLTTAPRGIADQMPRDLRRLGRLLWGLRRRLVAGASSP